MNTPRRATFNLRLWFGLASFLVIGAMGLVLAVSVGRFITDRMLHREAVVTQEFLESVITAENSAAHLFNGSGADDNPYLASFIQHVRRMPDVLRANLYGPDRGMVWSTDTALIGQRFDRNPELEEAFEDRLVTEVGSLSSDSKDEHVALDATGGVFIEVYIPIRHDNRVMGVVELYKVPTALDAMLREARLIIYLSVAAGTVVVFLTLFWIVRRGALLIEGQQDQLGRMEALAALGQMASAIAHNLRNPLAGIRSTAELLKLEQDGVADAASDIIGEVDRMDAYVRELLDYARQPAPAAAVVDARQAIEALLERFAPRLERAAIRLRRQDTAGPNVRVQADSALLIQAMTSIVANAIEAMRDGGTLTLRLGADDRQVTVGFDDTGPGIAPDLLQRISEPFFTTKTRGLGLGLALTRRIVERFGGSLEIGRAPEGGARVEMRLPRAAA